MAVLMTWIGVGILALASIGDIRRQEIPLWIFAAAAGVSLIAVFFALPCPVFQVMFSVIPGLILLAIAFLSRESIGYGDGLMILSLGPVYGWETMAAGVCLAFFASALLSVILLVLKRAGRNSRLPFMPFLGFAMGVVNVVSVL